MKISIIVTTDSFAMALNMNLNCSIQYVLYYGIINF